MSQNQDHEKQRHFLQAIYTDLAEAERLHRADPQSIHYRSSVGETTFHYLIIENQLDLAAKLLEWGSDINAQTNFGDTPLMHAVLVNNLEAVKWLIAHGANLELKNSIGDTALSYATRNDRAAIFKFLIDQPRKHPITYYYDESTACMLLNNLDLVMRDFLISLGLGAVDDSEDCSKG